MRSSRIAIACCMCLIAGCLMMGCSGKIGTWSFDGQVVSARDEQPEGFTWSADPLNGILWLIKAADTVIEEVIRRVPLNTATLEVLTAAPAAGDANVVADSD